MNILSLLFLCGITEAGSPATTAIEDSYTLARKAIANGDIEALRNVISHRGEPIHPLGTLNEHARHGMMDVVITKMGDLTEPGMIHDQILIAAIKAKRPDMVQVLVDANGNTEYQLQEAMRLATELGDSSSFEILLQSGRVNPTFAFDYCFRTAAENGHVPIVKLLLKDKRVNPAADGNQPIRIAAAGGYTEIVELLLKDDRVDPTTREDYPLRIASKRGYTAIVKALLETGKVDPAGSYNAPVIHASEMGHADIVELLLNYDPIRVNAAQDSNFKSAHDTSVPNLAIKWARSNGHTDVVNVLSKDTKVAAIEYVESPNPPPLTGDGFLNMIGSKNEWMNSEYINLLFSYPAMHSFFTDLFKIDMDAASTITSIDQLNTHMYALYSRSIAKSEKPLTRVEKLLRVKQQLFLYNYFGRTLRSGNNLQRFSYMTINNIQDVYRVLRLLHKGEK